MTAQAFVRIAEANDQAADYLADVHPEWAETLTAAAHIARAAAIAELQAGDHPLPDPLTSHQGLSADRVW